VPSSISLDDDAGAAAASRTPGDAPRGPVAIEVRNLEKTFRIPHNRVNSVRERVVHPFAHRGHVDLPVLKGISFDVHQGEFFGIVGRNGSGKSTLLKIMSSVYRADAGRIRIAGRLAPFIELGVGFNPELTSRENVVLNGVLMGLSHREARRRLDSVIDFAELQGFADLKLKNYSSGMLVRLAFAVMVEADADVMLIDEVLAVGDAAFASKCMDVFRDRRRAGKTVVLVTHDMSTVQSFCDRALVLHEGRVLYEGEPEEVALRYLRLNFDVEVAAARGLAPGVIPHVNAKLLDAYLHDSVGTRLENVEQGQPMHLNVLLETRRPLEQPDFAIGFLDEDGEPIFSFHLQVQGSERLDAGARVRIAGPVENRLLPGRYSIGCFISHNRGPGDLALHVLRLLEFSVYGTGRGPGKIAVDGRLEAVTESGEQP
jgi:ABC-type polysaccharide/polyol phosphate transport system ATPase subunit